MSLPPVEGIVFLKQCRNLQENVSFGLQMQPEELVVRMCLEINHWRWHCVRKSKTNGCNGRPRAMKLGICACVTNAYWHRTIQRMNEPGNYRPYQMYAANHFIPGPMPIYCPPLQYEMLCWLSLPWKNPKTDTRKHYGFNSNTGKNCALNWYVEWNCVEQKSATIQQKFKPHVRLPISFSSNN